MKQAGNELGVTASTVWNWENNRSQPEQTCLPAIIQFLGYNPLPEAEDLAGKLRRRRRTLGLSQAELARKLGIDPSTIAHWEQGRKESMGPYRKLVEEFVLGDAPAPQMPDNDQTKDDFSPRKLVLARKGLGLSRAAVARKLGISDHTLWRWERGDRTPQGLYRKLAARFVETEPAE